MNFEETDRKIALYENLVKEQEEIISKYEDRWVASKDEHFGTLHLKSHVAIF